MNLSPGLFVLTDMLALTEREKCAHILRRFGLGASEAELNFYGKDGASACIEKLLNHEAAQDIADVTSENVMNAKGNLNLPQAVVWFGAKLLVTRKPLLEKMTVFWHNHFATGADKVKAAPLMIQHIQTLEEHATGNFKELLHAISRDPAMLIWLDNTENIKGRANENFAREVMELFTLGIGHYSEKDVQEAARAFTGWSYKKVNGRLAKDKYSAEFLFKERLHDDGIKTVLGKTGPLDGGEVLDHLCENPQTAKFITKKFWEWFVYANPTDATLAPFADAFYKSGYDIKVLIRTVANSPEFFSQRAVGQLIKNPVDFCITTLRQLGIGEQVAQAVADAELEAVKKARLNPAQIAVQAMKSQGLWLMFPPDVSGWKPGSAWITSATMVERIAWANRIFGQAAKGSIGRYPAYDLFIQDPTPQGVAKKLCSVFDARLPGNKVDQLAAAAAKAMDGRLTEKNAAMVAAEVTRLIFGTPEFQVC